MIFKNSLEQTNYYATAEQLKSEIVKLKKAFSAVLPSIPSDLSDYDKEGYLRINYPHLYEERIALWTSIESYCEYFHTYIDHNNYINNTPTDEEKLILERNEELTKLKQYCYFSTSQKFEVSGVPFPL